LTFLKSFFGQNKIVLIIFLKNLVSQVDPPDPWPKPYLGSTLESGFKTMIITTFIHALTRVIPCWTFWPMTWAMPRSASKLGFKTMIITFILTLTWVNLYWPVWFVNRTLPMANPQIKFYNYDNNYFYFILTQVDLSDMWSELYLGSTSESGFKTMIITTFVLTLTRINDQTYSWLGPCPVSTFKLGFKAMIITTFIFTLT